jgi:hypothetical protein
MAVRLSMGRMCLLLVTTSLVAVASGPSAAFAYSYSELNHNANQFIGIKTPAYHYGAAATIRVLDKMSGSPRHTSVVAHKTDWTGWTECGHTQTQYYNNQWYAYMAWGQYGGYNMLWRKNVYDYEDHRYWTGYNSSNHWYYWWIDNATTPVGHTGNENLAYMTSSWPTLNVDGVAADSDAIAIWFYAKYRNPTWGSWSSFGSSGVTDYAYNYSGWDWTYSSGSDYYNVFEY